MTQDAARHEFTAEQVADLLDELSRRLRRRQVSAAVFVVGGAAMAVSGVRPDRLTLDIDALTDDDAVLEEAALLAAERGLPPSWLNSAARMWMPPIPASALTRPARPGLRITYADEGFLLATKLVAQRARDAEDLIALALRLGMRRASATDLEVHLRRYYTDPDALNLIVGGDNPDLEVRYLAEAAARLLARLAP